MAKNARKIYHPFGVEVTVPQLVKVAQDNGLGKSDQTVRNWINRYGEEDSGIEAMLIEKFFIKNESQLINTLRGDYRTIDERFEARNEAEIAAMGFPPFAKKDESAKELSDDEKKMLAAIGYKFDEKYEEESVEEKRMIVEEPVDNVPDMEDLRLVNRIIKDLKKIRSIPGFNLDIISECAETLTAARSISFDELIDWEAIAGMKGA